MLLHQRRGQSLLKILIPILLLLAASFAVMSWMFQSKKGPDAVAVTPEMIANSNAKPELKIDIELLKEQVTSMLGSLPKEASEIKSSSEAQAFLESLKVVSEQFGGLHTENWSDDVKAAVAPIASRFREEFSMALTKAFESNEVKGVIQPAAEGFLNRVEKAFQ